MIDGIYVEWQYKFYKILVKSISNQIFGAPSCEMKFVIKIGAVHIYLSFGLTLPKES
jgi:hypothetical protein